MKKKATLIPAAAAVALVVGLTTASAEASAQSDLIRYAHRVEDLADDLKSEFRTHYRRSAAYNVLINDAYALRKEALHIDKLAHDRHPCPRALGAGVRDLDKLAHHLHDVVDDVERGRYRGCVEGDTRHVHSLLSSLNRTIHSMERLVASIGRPAPAPEPRPRPSTKEIIIGEVIRAIADRHGHRH